MKQQVETTAKATDGGNTKSVKQPETQERKIVETMIQRMNLTTVSAGMTLNMVEENKKRTQKIEESIQDLDVEVDESEGADDKMSYDDAKDQIIKVVKERAGRHETD